MRYWNCKACDRQNTGPAAECQFCNVDHFWLQHEDDCTGYVKLHQAEYLVRGERISFTQLGDDAPVALEFCGVSKAFATERAAFEALAKWKYKRDLWLECMLPPIEKITAR